MTNLDNASEIIWKDCMGLQKGENTLVLCDKPLRSIGYTLFEKAVELGFEAFLMEIKPLTIHGEEPPSTVAETMKKADVVVIPTSTSLSHTDARRKANEAGARVATLPGITEDIMKRAIAVDYNQMKERSTKIADMLTDADAAYITTEKGTDVTISLKKREGKPDFGIYHETGDFGNLPAGEAYIAPQEGESEGTLVVDGAIAGVGKLNDLVTITIKDGMAKKIENCSQLQKMLDEHGEKARNVAELGIGTNEKATIIGNILEDEKAIGTVHVAFGNNVSFGGTVDVPVHLDCIISDPTLKIDDEIVLNKGKLTI